MQSQNKFDNVPVLHGPQEAGGKLIVATLGQQQQFPLEPRIWHEIAGTKQTQLPTNKSDQRRDETKERKRKVNVDLDKEIDYVSGRLKVDQWLLKNFKHTGEPTGGDLLQAPITAPIPPINTKPNDNSDNQYCNTLATLSSRDASTILSVTSATHSITVPQLPVSTPTSSFHPNYSISPTAHYGTESAFHVAQMTTTDLEQGHVTHSQVQQRSNQHTYNTFNNQQQHHQLQTQTHLINPFKMDADFWQQARSGSFGLHAAAALASNHIGHHHTHHQAQQTTVGNVVAQLHHPQQLHQQQQHLSGQVASADQQIHQLTSPSIISAPQQHHQPHLSQLCTEQNHHLLFNAAAAAAAAAHLSGVVSKSHELDSTNITQDEDNNDILSTNKSRNGECSSAATKQELQSALPGCSNNLLPTTTNSTHTDNNIHHQQSLQLQTVQQQQQPLKYEHESCTSNNLPIEALQQQLQQQVQHQQQQISADKPERDSGIQTEKHIANSLHANHHHNLQQEHQQRHSQQAQLTVSTVGRSGDNSNNESPTHLQQLRMQSQERRSPQDTQPPTLPLHTEGPLQINTFAKNGPTTTSPQPSLNSASGGSSTPDLKFNNENNKVPGELQPSTLLFLSVLHSAADEAQLMN
uniref:Uncharacterized protein n=1 Tax=Glossina pallidipes TaxID=7398 RepID=A0A1A9ZGG4_GLOPL